MQVVMPNTVHDTGHSSKLFQQIYDEIDGCKVVTVHRRYFNEALGMINVLKLMYVNVANTF